MATAFGAAAVVGITTTRHLVSGVVGSIESDRWRRIRGYAFNVWITALLWSLVWSRGEMPIVRAYLGDAGVAQYAAAMTLFGGAIQGVMLAVSGVAPQLAMLWGSERRDEAIAAARTIMDVQLLFCGAGALLLIWLGPELVALAFGKRYHEAAAPLTVFAVGLLAMAVSSQNYLLWVGRDCYSARWYDAGACRRLTRFYDAKVGLGQYHPEECPHCGHCGRRECAQLGVARSQSVVGAHDFVGYCTRDTCHFAPR
jgi:O-antigen/teichoic acid export membrane protein